jgi:N-acetylmuramoyl-L-alanine amidase
MQVSPNIFMVGAILCCFTNGSGQAEACSKPDFQVIIDVGHSREAPGATSARGRPEYDFNLQMAGLIEARLKQLGFGKSAKWVSPGPLSLRSRTAAENSKSPDLLVSVHHDSVQRRYLRAELMNGKLVWHSDHAKGWSLFVSRLNAHAEESERLARLLADRLLAAGLAFSKHHAEPIQGEGRTFIDEARGVYRYDGLIVLKRSRAPAVLLETGVIVNPTEELALMSVERQSATAEAVARAVEDFCSDDARAVKAGTIDRPSQKLARPPIE